VDRTAAFQEVNMRALPFSIVVVLLGAASLAVAAPPGAGVVKITPIGSHDGEYCALDRALLFEDPTGVRILYDPGRTTSDTDPRLGAVHAVLLSHMHADHLGEVKLVQPQTGTCAVPATVSTVPFSTTALVASAKDAMFIAGGEMPMFIAARVAAIRGVAASTIPQCQTTGLDQVTTVPVSTMCMAPLRPGGSRLLKVAGQSAGVRMATVVAVHTNGIPAAFLSPTVAPGTTGYVGDATGFVLEFSNGLTVYLTGDTGISSDMETVVRRFYRAQLIVPNLSGFFGIGARETTFIVNELVKPRSMIPEHASEVATSGGQLLPGTRTAQLIEMMHGSSVQVVLPLSGVTRHFDGDGNCVNCN
jgi:L-ascorbate metabolism protein UlaG (beta-lactamase superfamily)